ncbi:piggyBac transposable element-derived protein 4 isoform X1 [Rhipicephalus sanguineus]|uniref:piggyBac transposable element-derived protein 4 isoform X1 n=1 Tax=Rhipicephalus sanguineus TaxID=34632 RepID=UPI00189518E5|nr:piggyBac transposable element-derived protein 4 isoform X1 [Rhipicephalus sanguineus]
MLVTMQQRLPTEHRRGTHRHHQTGPQRYSFPQCTRPCRSLTLWKCALVALLQVSRAAIPPMWTIPQLPNQNLIHWMSALQTRIYLLSSDSDDEGATSQKRARRDDSDWIKGDYSPSVFPFDATHSGQVSPSALPVNAKEVEYFKLFFDEELVSEIVAATNKHANKKVQERSLPRKSRLRSWQETDVAEVYCFLAVVLLMGLVRKNTLVDYWSKDTMSETPFFRSIFSVKRFCLLLQVLHFSSLTDRKDRLRAIRPTMEKIEERFSAFFAPFQDLCINESLMPWRGRLSCRQYIPSERHRFGVKTFVLCDVHTGYILRFIVCTGATTGVTITKELGFTGSVVVELLRDFLDKGHSLFVDDWYTSPALFKFLLSRQTNACGTVHANRKGLPEFAKKLQQGEVDSYHSNAMLALKWHDRQDVHMLSTMHGAELAEAEKVDWRAGQKKKMPKCVLEYNKKMGLVDKVDVQPSFSKSIRKAMKWNKAFFFHLLDMSLLNAFILFRENTASTTTFADFKRQVVSQLIEEHHTEKSKRGRPTGDHPLRLTARHFIQKLPPTDAKKNRTQRRCHVCANTTRRKKVRKDTRYMCVECNKALCVEPCFEDYHTLKSY